MDSLVTVLLFAGLVAGVVLLVVFLIFREVVMWYWKINEEVALLKEIAGSLRRLEGRPDPDLAPEPVAWWERFAPR